MKKQIKKLLSAALFLAMILPLTLAGQAEAALVETSTDTYGAGSATLDTDTGLEWLDVTYTIGLSVSDVTALIAEGGTLEGWRYATADEVATLFTHAGLAETGTFTDEETLATIQSLFDLIGYTYITEQATEDDILEWPSLTAIIANGTYQQTNLNYMTVDGESAYGYSFTANFWYFLTTISSNQAGSLLVRDASAVPVPGAVWLLGSGLLGLACIRRQTTESAEANRILKILGSAEEVSRGRQACQLN